jgi:hypothetical protein
VSLTRFKTAFNLILIVKLISIEYEKCTIDDHIYQCYNLKIQNFECAAEVIVI